MINEIDIEDTKDNEIIVSEKEVDDFFFSITSDEEVDRFLKIAKDDYLIDKKRITDAMVYAKDRLEYLELKAKITSKLKRNIDSIIQDIIKDTNYKISYEFNLKYRGGWDDDKNLMKLDLVKK